MIKIAKLYLLIFVILNSVVIALMKAGVFSSVIFFYRGFLLIGLTAVLTAGGFLLVNRRTGRWRNESIVAATVIAASMHTAFFVTVPVTLDRSISVFLLNRIDAHETGISRENLTREFVSEYVYNQDAIGRRVREQSVSKNIEVSNDKIQLTGRGRLFLRVAAVIRSLYGIRPAETRPVPPEGSGGPAAASSGESGACRSRA